MAQAAAAPPTSSPADAAVVATGVAVEDVPRLTAGDEARYDLLDGALIRMSPAGFLHGALVARLSSRLEAFVADHRLGQVVGAETGFILGRAPDVLLAPDAAFVRADRLPPPSEWAGFLELAPDLAAEVVSPSDRWRLVADRVDRYLAAGTRLVWVVDPPRQAVTVFSPDGQARTLRAASGDALDGGEVLLSFRLPLADLFAPTP